MEHTKQIEVFLMGNEVIYALLLNCCYDREDAAHGMALQAMASLQSSFQTGITADKKSSEVNGDSDFLSGAGAQARKVANINIGIGETFGAMEDQSQIALMAKEKKNAEIEFFGGINATHSETAKLLQQE